jgi:hypothetical protein
MSLTVIKEGVPRGFLSEYTTILTAYRQLVGRMGLDGENIKVSSTMFSLYGHPSNWFDFSKIEDENSLMEYKYQMSTETIDFDPWPTEEQLNLSPYIKYFPYNDRIQNKLKANLNNFENCLGIHYRGTDHQMHVDRIPLEKYFDYVLNEFNNNNYEQVFISTDEENIIDKFQSFFKDKLNFTNIIFNDVIRSNSSTALHFSNFDSATRVELGDDVLLDSHSLSKCSTLICKTSNLINYARILNPNIKVSYLDTNLTFRG